MSPTNMDIDVSIRVMKDTTPRVYRMTARAEATARTGERIIDAMLARYAVVPYDRIRLEDVAADAEVTVQTVIRRFGTKDGLLAATVEREFTRLAADRAAAMGDSPQGTLHSLVGLLREPRRAHPQALRRGRSGGRRAGARGPRPRRTT